MEKAIQELQSIGLDLVAATKVSAGEIIQQSQQLISYGSPLLTTVMEMVAAPIKGLQEKVQLRKLAFLNQLRSVPRNVGVLAPLLE